MYSSSTMQLGQRPAKALPGARVETMCAPGAAMSGFAKPSCVSPTLDQLVNESSPRSAVPWSSTAPTDSANGSLPGEYDVASLTSPRLPAAATTRMPWKYADSTAASSGSVR